MKILEPRPHRLREAKRTIYGDENGTSKPTILVPSLSLGTGSFILARF